MSEENRLSCEVSRELNEPLYGTIKPADVFFLLEYNGTYEHEAWDTARIPQAVKDKLNAYPNGHTLLIRQPGKFAEKDNLITLFVVHANNSSPLAFRLDLMGYDEILGIDLDAVVGGDVVLPQEEPIYIVCTNGKRDTCCARWGVGLYNGLNALVGDAVWQSSHIGGHRLAATMYCFPHAICYGFLSEDDAPAVISSYTEGLLLLDKLRGRAVVEKPIQAAEYFLRRELNEVRINALHYVDHAREEDGWVVSFSVNGELFRIRVTKAPDLYVLSTTGDTAYKPMPQFSFSGLVT